MKDQSLRALIVEDSDDDTQLVLQALKKGGYNPVHERVETAAAMKKAFKEKQWDIILCDYSLPKFNAPSAIAVLKESNIDIPIIVVTGTVGEETAAECMRLGAQDYILKGNMSRLCPAIARELEDAKVRNKKKQAEENLRESERKYRNIYHYANVGLFETSIEEAKIIICNQYYCDLAGFPDVESALGKDIMQLYVNPGDREEVKKVLRTQGYITNHLLQLKNRLTNRIFWVEFNARVNPSRNIIEGSLIDVTERKKAEEDLSLSEERFRLLSEATFEAIAIHDEGVLLNANGQYFKMFGYEPGEALGEEMISVTFVPEVLDFAKKQIATGSLEPYESVGVKKDGTRFPIEIRARKMEYKGRIVRFEVIRDITERKQAEEALKVGEELYRTIFENTGTSMILIEEDMTISMANEEFVRNTGYSLDEIKERMKWTEIVHPDDLKRMIEQHRLRRESHGGRALPSYEFRYITKTGDLRDTLLTIKLVPGTKKSIASLIDITERKHAEAKLKQTLDSFEKAIGTTIQVLASAVESRDPYTAGHQLRVADLACAIATEIGFPQEKIEGIRMASSIHDIGKLSIPAEILVKPTKLTNIEFSLIKEHAKSGYEMLKDVESPWPLAEIVYEHHERMNGSGYPRNLKGVEILMESRILAVADVVEAMASHRPYRPGFGIEAALEEIEKNKGILYDNAVTDACLKLFREKDYQLT
jgi:PAS domain S-box-containing protein/putative nucleotidyltransferase with HDIG domain